MNEEEVAVGHSFDFTIKVDEMSFKERIELCNAFDMYEIERSVEELFIVDVIMFDEDEFVLRITVKKPLAYTEIDTYLEDLVNFAREHTGGAIKMSPVSIKWNVGLFGVPSTRIDVKAMTERASKMASLRSLRVDVAKEEKSHTEQQYQLPPGAAYLIKEKRAQKAFHIFEDMVTHGVPGLCISRLHPNDIKKRYGLKNTPLVWLTRREESGHRIIQPMRLPQLALLIQRFLEDTDESVIILEGTEYLIIHNNFNVILKLLQSLNDEVMSNNSRLLVPLDPDALEPMQMALMERDFKMLEK